MSFQDNLQPLADALRAAAQDVGLSRLGANVKFSSPHSFSCTFQHDEGQETHSALYAHEPLAEVLDGMRAHGAAKIVVDMTLDDGVAEAIWFESPAMDVATSSIGSLRVGRKRRKGAPPPAVALTRTRADNDLDEIARLLAGHGHTAGFTDEQIAKAEARRKVAFPEELRLFFSKVKKGTVLDVDEHLFAEVVDGLTAGTGKLGNVVDPAKRWDQPNEPLPAMRKPTPDDVVQPLYATPGWIVFADDGGGNQYALDTVPGPAGRIGQVVQFNHELDEPPTLVAWSLTDFLAGRTAEAAEPTPPQDEAEVSREVRLGDFVEKTSLTPEEGRAAVELTLLPSETQFDLGPLLGSTALTVLSINERVSPPLELGVLRTLTALEHLAAPPWAWEQIAAEDAWPPALVTAEIRPRAGTPRTEVAAANAILERYGKEPIEVHTWRG